MKSRGLVERQVSFGPAEHLSRGTSPYLPVDADMIVEDRTGGEVANRFVHLPPSYSSLSPALEPRPGETMHDAIQLTGELPSLRDPLALVALWGLADGTGSAIGAVRHLREQWAADEVAAVDPDRFYNLSAARPRRVQQGDEYVIRWPGVRFYAGHLPSVPRDVVLISGREPNLRWDDFTDAVASFLDEAGAKRRGRVDVAARRGAAHTTGAAHLDRCRPGVRTAARRALGALELPGAD